MSTELRVFRKLGALRPVSPHDTDMMSLLPEGMPIKIVATIHPRNQKAHNWFFGLLGVVAEATDKSIDSLLDEIKLGIGHTNKIIMSATGEVRETPRSISWAAMDEPTFKIFRERAIDYIMTDIMPGVDRADLVREVEERIAPNDNHERSEAAGVRAANNAGGGGQRVHGAPLPSEAGGERLDMANTIKGTDAPAGAIADAPGQTPKRIDPIDALRRQRAQIVLAKIDALPISSDAAFAAIGIIAEALQDAEDQALAKQPQWRPIETAPRDWSNFLVWDRYYGIRIGCYHRRADHDDWLSYRDAFNGSSKGGMRATHWMPLPPKPQAVDQ